MFDKDNYIELNGTPNFNGTSTSGTFTGGGRNYNIVIPCQPNTTYTIQKRNDGDTNRFAFCCSENIPSDEESVVTPILNGIRADADSKITITTAATAKYLITQYYRNAETVLTKQQLLDSIQIEEGTTPTPYEPHISESFPLSLKSRNLFDKNNTNILNAYIGRASGTIANSNGDKCLYISIKPNTTYTISKVLSNRFRIGCTDALPNSGITCTPFSGDKDTSTSYTITSNNSSKYLIIEYYVEPDILTEQQILDSIQIEKVDNLFDINNALNNNLYNQGTSLSLITNGIRATTEAVANYRMGLIKIGETNKLIGKRIRVKANFSSNGNNNGRFYIGYCDASGNNRVSKSDTTTSGSTLSMVVESGSGENICLVLYSNQDATNYTIGNYVDYKNIIMTIDNEDITYEPYYDINLCNISDYKDRIYSQNGEFYLEKKTGKVVLDGSENITQNYNQSMFRAPLDNFIHRIVSPSNLVKSNYYTCRKYTDMYNEILETGLEMGDQGNDYIYIRNKDITSINDFKTWLSTHNTEVQYVLATPTTTEITQENYPTLYSQLLAIQEFLTKYKINKEFLLNYSSLEIIINGEIQNPPSETGIDWSAIGYDGTPQAIKVGYDYAKSIYDSWDNTITSMSSKYNGNREIMIMPLVDTSNVTNMTSCFYSAHSFSIMPSLNTSNVTNMQQTFRECRALQVVPLLDTRKVTTMQNMFANCYSLTTVPLFDTSSINSSTSFSGMFNNCIKLTDESLDNILQMCVNATGYPGTKTLYAMGFINQSVFPVSRIEALPHYQDFIDAGWTIGY